MIGFGNLLCLYSPKAGVDRLTQEGVHELQEGEQVVAVLAVGRLHDARIAEPTADVAASDLQVK